MQRITFFFLACLLSSSCSYKEKTKSSPIIVALQPFRGFDRELLDTIAGSLMSTYNLSVVIFEEKALPENAFVNVKTPRYRADSLLRHLRKMKHDSISYIMGLTDSDISTTRREKNGRIKEPASKYDDWGIFGLGFRPGPISYCRFLSLINTRSLTLIQ